jgi:hypothetical protein
MIVMGQNSFSERPPPALMKPADYNPRKQSSCPRNNKPTVVSSSYSWVTSDLFNCHAAKPIRSVHISHLVNQISSGIAATS